MAMELVAGRAAAAAAAVAVAVAVAVVARWLAFSSRTVAAVVSRGWLRNAPWTGGALLDTLCGDKRARSISARAQEDFRAVSRRVDVSRLLALESLQLLWYPSRSGEPDGCRADF